MGRRNIEDARKLTRSFLGLSIASLFVIGGLIASLKAQDYPSELLDIYVIADNCTDNTAQVP